MTSILEIRSDNSGSGDNTNTSLKNAILSEVTQLNRQMETQKRLNSPDLVSLLRKYERMIEIRVQLYNEL